MRGSRWNIYGRTGAGSRYAVSVLGIDLGAARAVWTVFLFALLVATAYQIRETLALFFIALFFAYMLSPLVDFISKRLPRRISKPLALAIVYLALLGVLIGAGITLGGRVGDEASTLADRLPSFFQNPDWVHKIPLPSWLEPMRDRIMTSIQNEFKTGGKDWVPYITRAGTKVFSGIGLLFFAILVPILAFFFLKDGHDLRQNFLSNLTGGRKAMADEILKDVHILLGQYIRALVIQSGAAFVAYTLFLSITGAPYSVLLAGLAAALEFIPVVGPLGAAIIAAIVTGFSGYPHVLWLFVFYAVFRMFQDYVLSPYLMSSGVELHPLLVLFGVLAGEQVAGIPGMFFSVPVIAVLRVIYVQATRARRQRDLAPTPVAT